jgi:hypothetical protein
MSSSYDSPIITSKIDPPQVTPMKLVTPMKPVSRSARRKGGGSMEIEPIFPLDPSRGSSKTAREDVPEDIKESPQKKLEVMNIVETNIIKSSIINGSAIPDISWTEELEDKYQEELEYSWNNPELPTSFFGNGTGTTVTIDGIQKDINVTPHWYTTDLIAKTDKSKWVKKQTYHIDVNSLPAFDSLRGVGGAIYILRYFQFIDMVHDMCHKRGDKSNAWALNKKNLKTAYTKIKNLYVQDIQWLRDNDIKPYVKPYPTLSHEQIAKELAIFYSFICLNPKGTKLEFYDLYISFYPDGNPKFKKDRNLIPSDSSNTLRVQYLLSIFMKIAEIDNEEILRKPLNPASPCSYFLESNIDDILKSRDKESLIDSFKNFLNPKKIILHVDAESNRTGLCGIMPKFCDYAVSQNRTGVEYTKEFSSKEYDAAFIQQSEVYADLLNSSTHNFKVNLDASKSRSSTSIKLMYGDKVFMDFKYDRFTVFAYQEEIYMLLNDDDKGINDKISKKKITKNGLLYFLYLSNFTTTPTFPDKDTTIKTLISDVLGVVAIPGNKDKIIAKIGGDKLLKAFLNNYKIVEPKKRDGIKLTVTQVYSLTENGFGKNLALRYDPFTKKDLNSNENLSHLSSVRAITYGEYFNKNFALTQDDKVRNANVGFDFHHRAWFKHIGDFGQALEFYGYTHDVFNTRSWPIFVSFDKLSAYLSSMFNPLTCLENLKKDSINKLQFYFKSKRFDTGEVDVRYREYRQGADFGKVNYRMHDRRRYNISKRLKLMSESELKNKLKSVGIKITKNVRGKRKYLTRKELENKALLFNKLQNTAKRMKIKIMYRRNGIYKYKTYIRLQKEINSKYQKPVVRNFNFG